MVSPIVKSAVRNLGTKGIPWARLDCDGSDSRSFEGIQSAIVYWHVEIRIWERGGLAGASISNRRARTAHRDQVMQHRESNLPLALDKPVVAGFEYLACQFSVGHPVRAGGFFAQAADLVLLIGLEIALEPLDMGVALERQDVGREPIEEETVVA